MNDGGFKFADCLLKHFVRTDGWLPLCRERRHEVNSKKERRLRYLTFCAVDAIDVLMLDVARIIIKSQQDTFDTVCFFDRDAQHVIDTQKSIPGAIGIVGKFVDTVLAIDPSFPEEEGVNESEPLAPETDQANTAEVRSQQRILAARKAFVKEFPFDIVNLDLEDYLVTPKDKVPGKLINAIRKVFEWQHLPRQFFGKAPAERIASFSLMLTTRVGPPNLGEPHLAMLRDGLASNLARDNSLEALLEQRTGYKEIAVLENSDFESFFKLAVPKIIASALMEKDWHVDPAKGIKVYEFERVTKTNEAYKILHFAMDVKEHDPPHRDRAPGANSATAAEAYQAVVRQLFSTPETVVNDSMIDKPALQASLDKINGRRNKYRGGDA